jgi:arabinogalactan oligomer/maltooligosaccharide transport system permease protein
MFPAFLSLVAIYLILQSVGDVFPFAGLTRVGLILVYLGGALGVNTWLMKGFFDTIPNELDESARVDGATPTQIFWGVILPLAVPVLAVIALISYIFTLNEFVIASFVLQKAESQTLIVGLHGFIQDKYAKNWGPFAAGVLLTAIAPTALFFALQRYIVEGLTGGAVKG